MRLQDLLPAVIVVVVVILTAAFSGDILGDIRQGQCNTTVAGGGYDATTGTCYANSTTVASNITGFGLTSLTNMTEQMPNVGLILVVAVIIGILVGAFLVKMYKK